MPSRHGGGAVPPAPPAPPVPRAEQPLSRPFEADRVHVNELVDVEVRTNEAERHGVAKLLDLKRVETLEAALQVSRIGTGVRVIGRFSAAVVQTCVVTLEPFPVDVADEIDVRFAPQKEVDALVAAAARRSGDNITDIAEIAELPDTIVGGRIDLGDIVVEALALALDPYPRKPGTTFGEKQYGEVEAEVSPFAVLRNVKPAS